MRSTVKGRVPLARALSKLGIMSRTEAVRRILSGDVRIEGRIVRNPGLAVVPEQARISVAGHDIPTLRALTILMNKRRGVVTTRRDPEGRPTVYDTLTPDVPYVTPVGRLDMASAGLLLLTNNTRLSDWLLDPANAIPRTYVVTVRGELSDEDSRRIERGIRDRGELLKARSIEVLKRSRRETHARVELVEGRNRELRRLFAACGHEVTRLKRVAFGAMELGALAPGAWRVVNEREIRTAFPQAPESVVRSSR